MKDSVLFITKVLDTWCIDFQNWGLRRQFYPREAKKDISVNELESWRKHLAAAN